MPENKGQEKLIELVDIISELPKPKYTELEKRQIILEIQSAAGLSDEEVKSLKLFSDN